MTEDLDDAIQADIRATNRALVVFTLVLLGLVALVVGIVWVARARAHRAGYDEGHRHGLAEGIAAERLRVQEAPHQLPLSSCLVRLRDLEAEHQQALAACHERVFVVNRNVERCRRYEDGLNEGMRVSREDWTVQGWECLGAGRARR